jgi:MFS family permease
VGLLVGFGQSVFSIAQLLTGVWIGKLSDEKGRKVVLLGSVALSTAAYILYANTNHLLLLFLSRALSGVAASNLGVAFAYVADVSKPEERSAKLGLLGAAFGIGFIFGPVLGAQLLSWSNDSPNLLGYFAAVLCAINFFLILAFVQESKPETGSEQSLGLFKSVKRAFSLPGLATLLLAFFMMNLAFANLETTYFRLLAAKNWHFNFSEDRVKTTGALILSVVGIASTITQGALIGPVTKRLGELRTLQVFYSVLVPVLASIPFSIFPVPHLPGAAALGICNGMAMPNVNALISKAAPEYMRGSVMGLAQSLGSLARVIGPLISNLLFQWSPAHPYIFGALLGLVPVYLLWMRVSVVPTATPSKRSDS